MLKIVLFVAGWLACGIAGFGIVNDDFKREFCIAPVPGINIYAKIGTWWHFAPLVVLGPMTLLASLVPNGDGPHLEGWSITDTCPHAQ